MHPTAQRSVVGRFLLLALLTSSVAGCGGTSGNGPPATNTPPPATYSIGGTVIGLASSGTVHVLNGNDNDAITSNGSFKLPTAVASGGAFNVSLGNLPTGQVCAVNNGSGTVSNANVTNVLVYCTYVQSAATLNGSYDGAGYNINNNANQAVISVAFDGAGNEGNAGTLVVNSAGVVTTSTNSSNTVGPYTVVTTNAIPVLTTGGNNIGAIAGADGDEFFWLANSSTGGLPALAAGVRPLQNGSIASLAGNWCIVNLNAASTSPSDPRASEAFLTINADGSFSGSSTTMDLNGVVTTSPQSAPAGSITVTSSGQFGSIGGSLGFFSANGEFLVSTETGTGAPTGLQFGVKQGGNPTLATLNGVYTVGSLAFFTANTGDGKVLTLFFDGAGNYSGTYFNNNSGNYSTGGSDSGTYSVTSAGVLTLTDAGGGTHIGAVSAEGNIIVAANVAPQGNPVPRIFVGLRQ